MSKNIKGMISFEYYYMGDVSYKQVHKWHKKDANRRYRRFSKQEVKVKVKALREEDYNGKI